MAISDMQMPIGTANENLEQLKVYWVKQQGPLERRYEEFQAQAVQLLVLIQDHMTDNLDTDPVVLPQTIIKLSTLSYSTGQFLADAKSYLQIYEQLHYKSKGEAGMSEADRKLQKQSMTIRQNNLVQALGKAADALDKRITVIQSIMKAETARMVRGEHGDPSTGDSQH